MDALDRNRSIVRVALRRALAAEVTSETDARRLINEELRIAEIPVVAVTVSFLSHHTRFADAGVIIGPGAEVIELWTKVRELAIH